MDDGMNYTGDEDTKRVWAGSWFKTGLGLTTLAQETCSLPLQLARAVHWLGEWGGAGLLLAYPPPGRPPGLLSDASLVFSPTKVTLEQEVKQAHRPCFCLRKVTFWLW